MRRTTSNRQQPLDAGQVDPRFVDEMLDEPQALELVARVEPHAADGPAGPDEAETLVFPERLRVHPEELSGHADEVELGANRHDGSLAASIRV
jgi:hypothetical protein